MHPTIILIKKTKAGTYQAAVVTSSNNAPYRQATAKTEEQALRKLTDLLYS